MTDQAALELTILMPCLNEAETLATCINKARDFLSRSGISGEVLIADNGSTDGSIGIAEASGARVINVSVKGYGSALLYGIRAARGKFVIMGDADDSYDFRRLESFVEKLRAGNDLVMGNRFQGGIAPSAMPFLHRYLGNPVLSFIGRLFFSVPIGDFHCGLRGLRRDSILALGLMTSGMEFASEMVVRAALTGLSITEVPTTLHPDGRSRRPHLNTWRDGWRHLRFLLMFSPRWLFLYPGIASLVFGAVLTFALLPGPVSIAPHVTLDVHSVVIGCLAMLVGTQSISFAIVARKYAAVRGFLPRKKSVMCFLGPLTLERALIVAGLLLVGGLAGIIHCVNIWRAAGFGPLEYGGLIRILTVSATTIVLALQVAFTAFLSAILEIDFSATGATPVRK